MSFSVKTHCLELMEKLGTWVDGDDVYMEIWATGSICTNTNIINTISS